MAASVCMRSTSAICCWPPVISGGISRFRPLMIPEVTVDWKPDGLPAATASWPTTRSLLSPNSVAGRLPLSTLTTAMSV